MNDQDRTATTSAGGDTTGEPATAAAAPLAPTAPDAPTTPAAPDAPTAGGTEPDGTLEAGELPPAAGEYDDEAAAQLATRLRAEEEARAREAAEAARAAAIANAVPPTPEELAALAAEVEAARPIPRPLAPEPTALGPDGKPLGAPTPRRARARQAGRRLGGLLLGAALLVLGVAIGYQVYLAGLPVTPRVGDPATDGVGTPAAVTEFTAALSSVDADALRSALDPDPYRLIAGELQALGMRHVDTVETLATMLDGTRSATEIVMKGSGPDGQPLTMNLVVHVVDNKIVSFR